MGYDFTGGRISHFSIDFCMGFRTVQRKGAACDRKQFNKRRIWVPLAQYNKVSRSVKNGQTECLIANELGYKVKLLVALETVYCSDEQFFDVFTVQGRSMLLTKIEIP